MRDIKELQNEYNAHRAKNLKLDMSRGKPCTEQLELSRDMLSCLTAGDYKSAAGFDCRNYGLLDGLPEAKQLFADMLDVPPPQLFIGGNSSLQLMYAAAALLVQAVTRGGSVYGAAADAAHTDKPKFICPVPGYDRHFGITEFLGVEMLNVPVTESGVDIERARELVKDSDVIGMWCVPMYSNPGGVTYSDDNVRALAALKPVNPAFRIFWDNAYAVHHLSPDPAKQDRLLNILPECEKAGNPHLVYVFASTSKISLPGSGISVIAASPENIAHITKQFSFQTIGYDKLNQLRHVRFFKNFGGIVEHMKKHADVIAPRFQIVLDKLAPLSEYGCTWHKPNGGYFISFNGRPNTAKETVRLCKEAGVVLTGAGAAFPYGKDPDDSNIRIAPTFPSAAELTAAMDVFVTSAKIAAVSRQP